MVEAMNEYWRDHPPLHLMVAAYLGIKPSPSPSAQLESLDELAPYVPMSTMPADAFDAQLRELGLLH